VACSADPGRDCIEQAEQPDKRWRTRTAIDLHGPKPAPHRGHGQGPSAPARSRADRFGDLALTDPAIAKLTQILLDRGFYDRQDKCVPVGAAGLVVVFLVRGWANYVSSYKISSVSQSVLVELRRRMFERLLHWRAGHARKNTPPGS